MLFLLPNQLCESTEGKILYCCMMMTVMMTDDDDDGDVISLFSCWFGVHG